MRFKLLVIIIALCCGMSMAQDFIYDGFTYTILDYEAKTCSTKRGALLYPANDVEGDWVLPSEVYSAFNNEWYTLTEIAPCSFANTGDKLTGMSIPETVTTIGAWAFNNCFGLKDIDFPSSLVRIEECAFQSCHSMKSVVLKEGVKYVGNSAFNTPAIECITFPSTVEVVGERIVVPLAKKYMLAATPPMVIDGDGNPSKADWEMYIPKGTLDRYLASPYWSDNPENYTEMAGTLVVLDRTSVSLYERESMQLRATFIAEENIVEMQHEWTSSDYKVANVDAEGNVSGLNEGEAVITYTVTDTNGNTYSDSCKVSVLRSGCANFDLSVEIPSIKLEVGQTMFVPVEMTGMTPGTARISILVQDKYGQLFYRDIDVEVIEAGVSTGVEELFNNDEGSFDIYNIRGNLIQRCASNNDIRKLEKGLYVINKKLIFIK